jgi:hypothetical protein
MELIQTSLVQMLEIVMETPFWILFAVGTLLVHIVPAILLERLAYALDWNAAADSLNIFD